ncbi:hypothetical protein [Taklimakanibacter lacteus]|uniref:hypothetical protein n=1 Tax=Taklimakanibacter lacteus TaxID=2268456 RepID=UPI000E66820F
MTLATLRTSFSRPESEVICCYLASAGIPALPGERHHATCNSDYLVAQQGIHIQVPEAFLDEARSLLSASTEAPQLSESRAFARHYVANALALLALLFTLAGLGFGYFPYWLRSQRNAATTIERGVSD